MPSIKRDRSQLNIQVVRESHGRISHDNRQTATSASRSQSCKRNAKTQGQSHRGAEPYLSLSSDNGRNLDVSSASSLSTKSAFARLGTQGVVTQVTRRFTKVPDVLNDGGPCHSLSSDTRKQVPCHSLSSDTKKQVIVEKHSPSKKTFSKPVSSSFPNPPELDSFENIAVFKDNFHSIHNPEIFVPSVQHTQPEIVTITPKEPKSFDQQLQNNFEKELVPASISNQLENQFTEEIEAECLYEKEAVNTVYPQDQIPTKEFTNVLDSKVTNSDLLNGISASETSPAEKKAAVEGLENKSVKAVEISSVGEKESANAAGKPEQKDCCPCSETTLMEKTVSTVAAATAAAMSAHPLLTSHNRLEVQLMTLLDKMNSLEQQIFLQKSEMEKEEKLQKLESQLSQVTDDRMGCLEFLQKQMFAMQTNFLTVAKGFEKMFGRIPDNVQQKIEENEGKTEPLHYKHSKNVQHSNDAEISEEHDSSKFYFVEDFVLTEDKIMRKQNQECHIEKASVKNAPRLVQSEDISAPFMKPKIDSSNRLMTQKASNIKTKVVNARESKSSSKPNKSASSVNSTSKSFQNTKINKNKKYQPNVQEKSVVKESDRNMHKPTSVVKESDRNMHKPTSVAQRQSVEQLPLKYSYLRTFSSNPYSKEPYVVREAPQPKHVPKKQSPPVPTVLNTSYIISSSPESHEERKELNEIENRISNPKKCFTSLQSEAPLEKYLLDSPLKTQLFTSDNIYAGLKSATPSAELVAGQEILQRAQTSRMFLEENLKNLERDYEKDAVYNIVDNLYQSSPVSQTYQMKRKVDQCIAKMQLDIQKELSLEEATANKLSWSKPTTKVNTFLKKKDSEALNGPRQKQPKFTVKKNEKLPQGSNKNINVLYQDQEYLTQVFGKATYQNKRTTIREPYLHIRNKPQARMTQPKAMVDVKGIQKKSAKTQTVEEKIKPVEKGTGIMADDKKYFFASKPNNDPSYLQNSSLVAGHLGYMAVSLREPRMDSGLTHAVTVTPGSSVVVAPQDQPKVVSAGNVVLCNVPFADEEKPTKKSMLSKQDLPSVDIVGKLTEDKDAKTVNISTDSQEKNVQNTSFEKLVTLAESTDNEDGISCERSSEGSVIAEVENQEDVDVVVVNYIAKETSESVANNNNSNRILPRQLESLTGLTSELMLTRNHKIAATLATSQRMPVDAESIRQEETLSEIVQLVEQELLCQIISSHQLTPNSEVDHLKKNSSTGNNGGTYFDKTPCVKSGIPKVKDSITEDSLIMSQLIEEILADKVSTILANDYTLNIPTSDKLSVPTSPNQLKKDEICPTKLNESLLIKHDAVCQTSESLSNELILEDLALDTDSNITDNITSENAVISLPPQPTSAKEPVPVDIAIPSETDIMVNQKGSITSINDETAMYSTNEVKLLNLNKNSVEQGEKISAQQITTAGGGSDGIPVLSYGENVVKDSNRDAAQGLTEDTVQPTKISVMQHSENIIPHTDSTMQNTDAATRQNLGTRVQPSASKVQSTNATAMQLCVGVVAQDYNKDTVNILGGDARQSETERRTQEIQRRREATLARLRIDKMESIYIPPATRVRSPVRHVKLVEITSKSLNETQNEANDQFVIPSLPSQLSSPESAPQPLPSQLSSPESAPHPLPSQSPSLQLPLQLPTSHKTTPSHTTTTSSQFSPPRITTPPPSIVHFQTSDAGKQPRSLFSPEKLDFPKKAEVEENSMVTSFEGLNLVPTFDDYNDNNQKEIPASDNEVISESSPSSDKVSSESLSSRSGSSNTAFESLSDGQWLLSQSEGQAALYTINDGVYKRILTDVSINNTLKDSNELTRDEMAENTYSDGEFVLQQRVPPEKDPVLQLILNMENTTLNSLGMIPGNTDADVEGQTSPGELVLSSSEIGQTTFETSSDYVAASSANMKPVKSSKTVKTVLPQQSSYSSRQSHVYRNDKSKTNSRVIFVGLTHEEKATAAKSELGLENQQDQIPVVINPQHNGSLQRKAPNTNSGQLLSSKQSSVQSTVRPSTIQSSNQTWSKSVHFNHFSELDPVVSNRATYNGSQHVDASAKPDIHKTLSGDSDDMKDAQSLPRPPLLPHRIPVAIPSPGEIWDDEEDIEEISFQDGI